MFVFCFNWKTEGSHLVKISRFSKATRVSLVTLKFNLWFIILLFSTGYHGAIHPFLFCFIIARSQSVTSNRNAIHSLLTFWIATSEIKLRELTQLTKCVLPYCNYQSNCTNPIGCSPPCLPATSKTNLETSAPHALDWGRRKVCTILWGEGSLRTWEKSRKRKWKYLIIRENFRLYRTTVTEGSTFGTKSFFGNWKRKMIPIQFC